MIEGVCGALHTRIKQGAAGTACQRQKRGPRPYVVWTDASGTVQVLELVWHSATDQMLPSEASKFHTGNISMWNRVTMCVASLVWCHSYAPMLCKWTGQTMFGKGPRVACTPMIICCRVKPSQNSKIMNMMNMMMLMTIILMENDNNKNQLWGKGRRCHLGGQTKPNKSNSVSDVRQTSSPPTLNPNWPSGDMCLAVKL